ncbi:MAG TPA: DUF192 domain-containing protein [Acidimicrobiia bacterium]|jgi:uncharacterized membrane protein (UPF0127 family)|nr:DUF192 domain-containing protein [Acidimicrobiia bacterium]
MTGDLGQHPPEDLVTTAPAGAVEVVTGLSKAYRWRLAGVAFVAAFVLILLWGSNRPANPSFADASSTSQTTATGPTFADKKVGVGTSCLHVLVADTPEKRAHGLRNRSNLEGYDGMIFEFGQTMNAEKTRFTMSDVKFPLTIGFYNESGLRVDAADMEPCSGTDSNCPSYGSKNNFNVAIETPKGKLPDGPLTACPG